MRITKLLLLSILLIILSSCSFLYYVPVNITSNDFHPDVINIEQDNNMESIYCSNTGLYFTSEWNIELQYNTKDSVLTKSQILFVGKYDFSGYYDNLFNNIAFLCDGERVDLNIITSTPSAIYGGGIMEIGYIPISRDELSILANSEILKVELGSNVFTMPKNIKKEWLEFLDKYWPEAWQTNYSL